MTIQDILTTLQSTLQKLNDAGIDDDSRLDLQILVRQLQRQLLVAAFDPLKDIDSVTVADTSQLPGLVTQVQTAINTQNATNDIVEKIIATAKVALRAAGVAIP